MALIVAALALTYFGHDIWEKVGIAVAVSLAGTAMFLPVWAVMFVRTPWKFEDEEVIARAAEHKGMLDKMDELGRKIEGLHVKHREEVASLKMEADKRTQELAAKEKAWHEEKQKLQNSDVDRNLKRHKIQTYLDDFRRFLERLIKKGTQAESEQAISEMYKHEANVHRCLLDDFKYDDFRRHRLSLPTRHVSWSDMQKMAMSGKPSPPKPIERTEEDRSLATECCKDRITHLERLQNIIG